VRGLHTSDSGEGLRQACNISHYSYILLTFSGSAHGDGTLQAAVDHPNLTKNEWAMVAPDLSREGLADLVITDLYNLAVFPNLGNCP
jgi:hypothetical protein